MKTKLLLTAAACATTLALATTARSTPSAERMLARAKVLASDEFEGRAPASPGEEKTVAYLVSEFKKRASSPATPTAPTSRTCRSSASRPRRPFRSTSAARPCR